MSKIRLAINGFGRVGRAVFKIAHERSDIEIVAINDLADNDTLAYLLKHDSTYGLYGREVVPDATGIVVDGHHVRVLTELNPERLPWDGMGIDAVIEATGAYTTTELAARHIAAGARRVVVTAALRDEGDYYILGVNDSEGRLAELGNVVSMGSCTANAVAPLVKLLKSNLNVQELMVNNVHSFTNDQPLQDSVIGYDTRLSRAAASNIIPVGSNAGRVLKGVLGGIDSMESSGWRVPVQNVAVSEVTFISGASVDKYQVNEAIERAASEDYYQGIIGTSTEPLVSSDYIGNPNSCVVDLGLTSVAGERLVKVVAWYDNEWGYAARVVELVDALRKVDNDA